MKRNKRKFFSKMLRLIIFLGLAVSLFLLWRLEPFLVKNIVVTTDYDIKTDPGMIKILEGTRKQNILSLKTDRLAQTIMGQDIKIKEVKIQKKFPGELLIKIIKRQALAAIPWLDKYFLVDENGLIFVEEKQTVALPILNLSLQNITVGSRIDGREKAIFTILFFLKGKEEVINIVKEAETYVLQLNTGTQIIFPAEGETEVKLNSLQMILNRFKIEGKRLARVDLRFEKPVISF